MLFIKKLIIGFAFIVSFSGFIYSKEIRDFAWKDKKTMNTPQYADKKIEYECSEGWRITGYFTPIETDYDSTETKEIEIKNFGTENFNTDFLRVVFDEDKGWGEGWGKTRFGWYVGYYDGEWHKSDAPLDSNNQPLQTNSVAVDNSIIPYDSVVQFPGLPDEYGEKTFIANDVGVTVHGKHIDVYTGEGKEAEREMYRVTFEDDNLTKVCYKKP